MMWKYLAYNDTLAEKQDLKCNDFIITNIFKKEQREKEWENLSQNLKKNEKNLDSLILDSLNFILNFISL